MDTSRFAEFSIARRFRIINRIAQIVLSLSLIISLNFLAAKYFERYDLTEAGTYTLAAETKAYIRQLAEPVDIVVTIPDSPETELVLKDLKKLLRQYEAEDAKDGNAMLNIEFVDIYKQRARAQQLASRYKLTRENVVLVASGENPMRSTRPNSTKLRMVRPPASLANASSPQRSSTSLPKTRTKSISYLATVKCAWMTLTLVSACPR